MHSMGSIYLPRTDTWGLLLLQALELHVQKVAVVRLWGAWHCILA